MQTKFSSAGLLYLYINGYIENGNIIINHEDTYHSLGNGFFQCVQTFFCKKSNHFPSDCTYECGDYAIKGLYDSRLSDQEIKFIVDEMIHLWICKEQPVLCGRQLMIQSFFLQDFVGRKVIARLPNVATDTWKLVFEGGIQLFLQEDFSYYKGTIHPEELGVFSSSSIQTILLNPIYAFGKCFQPNDLCEEWHKVFLYLCAVSKKNWDLNNIDSVYEKFLAFLEEHICETIAAPPMLTKEKYYQSFLMVINQFRNFLKGEDESVVSKDLHKTMNSRYVYLPYLWKIVNPEVEEATFSASELQTLIESSSTEKNVNKKGLYWETVAEYVLKSISGWKVTNGRVRAMSQEIDRSVVNVSLDDELWQLGAYILVECKNWNEHVGVPEIRNISHICSLKGNKTAILFAANGITKNAKEEIKRLAAEQIYIIYITANELQKMLSKNDVRALILEKWNARYDGVSIANIL